MWKRILVLPIAAVIIAGLCAYKLTRRYETTSAPESAVSKRRAPAFALFDHHKPPQPVRLEAYLGRHEILLVFFDGQAGFDPDPVLTRLLNQRDELKSSGLIVLGLSTALPQENRAGIAQLVEAGVLASDEPLPFRLLSDVDYSAHEAWGRWDAEAERTRPGVFFIDRAGNVEWTQAGAQPLRDVNQLLDQLLGPAPLDLTRAHSAEAPR